MAMDLFSGNRIGELEEKIDGLITSYMAMKKEKEEILERVKTLELENKGLKEKMTESSSERDILMEKVLKILEKVEKVEV